MENEMLQITSSSSVYPSKPHVKSSVKSLCSGLHRSDITDEVHSNRTTFVHPWNNYVLLACCEGRALISVEIQHTSTKSKPACPLQRSKMPPLSQRDISKLVISSDLPHTSINLMPELSKLMLSAEVQHAPTVSERHLQAHAVCRGPTYPQ